MRILGYTLDDALDYGIAISIVALTILFVAILWKYIKGLWGSPRELYMLYIGKLLEYAAYGAINYTFVRFLHKDGGLTDVQAGAYIGYWSMLMTVCSILLGAVCDAIGIRKTLLLGTAILIISRATLPFIDNVYLVTFTSFLPLAVGMGALLPVLSVGIKYYTTSQGSALGFALFYTLMNVGWALGAWIFDKVRDEMKVPVEGEPGVFDEYVKVDFLGTGIELSTYQVIFFIGFLLTLPQIVIYFLFRPGVRMTDDKGVVILPPRKTGGPEGQKTTIAQIVSKAARDTGSMFRSVYKKKAFWIFIFMMAMLVPVRLVFYHFHYTWPTYGIRIFGDGAKVGTIYGVLNPVLVIYLAPVVAAYTKKISSYKMLVIGTCISVGATVLAVLPPEMYAPLMDTWFGELVFDRWLDVPEEGRVPLYFALIFFVIVFTIGEAIWSPRLMQFTAEIAPGGKEGTYIALSYIPYFAAKMVVGPMSGMLLGTYVPEGQDSYPNHWLVWVWIGGMAAITPVVLIAMRRVFRKAGQEEPEEPASTAEAIVDAPRVEDHSDPLADDSDER